MPMIKLGRLTDYAVILLTRMVGSDASIWAASGLAEKTGLPLPTVSKVLKQLAKSGVVETRRGAAGGYRLAKPAMPISDRRDCRGDGWADRAYRMHG